MSAPWTLTPETRLLLSRHRCVSSGPEGAGGGGILQGKLPGKWVCVPAALRWARPGVAPARVHKEHPIISERKRREQNPGNQLFGKRVINHGCLPSRVVNFKHFIKK